MKSYSLDSRTRIVAAVAGGQTKTAVSERFEVSRSTVKRYAKRQHSGSLAPSQRPGRQRRLDLRGCEQLQAQVAAHHDWSLAQHAEALAAATGVEIKKSSVGNYLKRLGITHKKRASMRVNEVSPRGKATSKR